MEESETNVFGLAHLWASGDLISHAVAILLLLMSMASWYLILAKLFDNWQLRKVAGRVAGFWSARSIDDGVAVLRRGAVCSPYAELAAQAVSCNANCCEANGQLAARFRLDEQLERALRQQLSVSQARLENGLTLLATTGATAPFVGLFGTVWGIYHALVAIGISGQGHCCKVSDEAAFCLIQRPYISKTLLTRRISPRGSP